MKNPFNYHNPKKNLQDSKAIQTLPMEFIIKCDSLCPAGVHGVVSPAGW